MKKNYEYYNTVLLQLDRQVKEEEENIEKAAQFCADSVCNDRIIHAFGCGHSQMFGEEMFYRSGGLVPVNAILHPHYSLVPKARISSAVERQEGLADKFLANCNHDSRDTMIITSISGRNAAVIDMAIAAKKIGMKVVALVSQEFSSKVTSRHSSGKNLKDFADVVIDIKCVYGDACLEMEGVDGKFGGTSTILAMMVVEMISTRTIELCAERGYNPPIFVSGNTDIGDKLNNERIEKYSKIIPTL